MQRNKSCDVGCPSDGDHLGIDAGFLTYMSDPEAGPGHDEPSTSGSTERNPVAHLPENAVRLIALHTLQAGGRQLSFLSLLSMCGVCKHWRSVASYLEPGSHLHFDGTRGNAANVLSTFEQRFRALPQFERALVLRRAARLFRGALRPEEPAQRCSYRRHVVAMRRAEQRCSEACKTNTHVYAGCPGFAGSRARCQPPLACIEWWGWLRVHGRLGWRRTCVECARTAHSC
jgi:hypothetical protein